MWDHESLYKKAKFFVRRGLDHEIPDSPEVSLWCIFALELLARATLSRINPALLADPKEGGNILSACGFPTKKAPLSIPAKTAFHRCTVVCKEFSAQDYEKCMEWSNWRNEELHTGALPFEELRTSTWVPYFFKICEILLKENETTLEDFLGQEHATTAKKIMEALSAQVKKDAFELVKKQRAGFSELAVAERLAQITTGIEKVETYTSRHPKYKEVKCPSCEGKAVILGALVRSTVPKADEGNLSQEDVWLPTDLACPCCSLKVKGHAFVAALGLGDQFVTTDILDPQEYYQIEFDPSDYFHEEYMNE